MQNSRRGGATVAQVARAGMSGCASVCLMMFGVFFLFVGAALTGIGYNDTFSDPFFGTSPLRVVGPILLTIALVLICISAGLCIYICQTGSYQNQGAVIQQGPIITGGYQPTSHQMQHPPPNQCYPVAPPQGYNAQTQGYNPQQGYHPPPQGYQATPQGYQPPPKGYQPPPQQYQPPPQEYQPPPQAYQSQSQYQSPSQPQGYQAPPHVEPSAPPPGTLPNYSEAVSEKR